VAMMSSASMVNVIGSFLLVSFIDDIHCSFRRHMQVNSAIDAGVSHLQAYRRWP
jgi:hypothetical protein